MKKYQPTLSYVIGSLITVMFLANCNKNPAMDPNAEAPNSGSPSAAEAPRTGAPATPNYVQIERLARPGINELFVYSNDLLAAYNAIPPTADLSAAAAPVRAQVATILGALDTIQGQSANTPPLAQVVSGFLPDVMRIDLTANTPVGTEAYSGCLSATRAILCGGRKIEDDVIKTSYSYLITGNPGAGVDDNITYANGLSCNDTASDHGTMANRGHRCLHGQTTRNGAASFPFLAKPHITYN